MADNVRDRKAQELHKNTTSFWYAENENIASIPF